VIVVGAGVLGAALAWTLARHGAAVTLVEQYEPGHRRAASGARTRTLRLAHGADVDETRSAWSARRGWLELERDAGKPLFSEVGMAWLAADGDNAWEAASEAVLGREGIRAERLSPAEARRLLPGLQADDLDHVLFEPQAGVLDAAEAVRALVEAALDAGAQLLRGAATPGGASALLGGRRVEGDRVVWACGAWTARLFPELVRGTVIQQDAFYFETPFAWASRALPAWGERRRSASGSGGGSGFKVGLDTPGPAFDPDSEARQALPVNEAQARAYLGSRFPALASAPLIATETCQTVELDAASAAPAALLGGEVRVVRHPEHEQVWLLGDGSGHAFKHAPAIAGAVESLLA